MRPDLAQRLVKDPRFKRPPKAVSKVAVDARFQRMFTDKSFAVTATVDKYGRKLDESSARGAVDSLRRLYRQEEEEEEEEEEGNPMEEEEEEEGDKDVVDDDDDVEEEEDADNDDETQEVVYDPMRGEGVQASSSDEEWEDDMDSDVEQDLTGFELQTLDKIDVPVGEQTKRVAVVNLDWDHVRAQDLLQLLDSFKPTGGTIASVAIYLSEFGKQRIAQEEQEGPPRSIFKTNKASGNGNDDDDGTEMAEEERQAGIKHTVGDAESDINQVELRKYQLERLRYYYAVVVCDSVETAAALYKACDGLEYENSANMMDLRFIPDEETFDEQPRDVANQVLQSYDPLPFETKALQHTNADLTWDEDDPARMRVTRRKFTKEDMKSMDFNAYLASSDSDNNSDEDDEADKGGNREQRRAMYRTLLQESLPREEPEQEMEITFTTGLADVATNLLKKKKNQREAAGKTVWEQYLETRKQKRKERRAAKTKQQAQLTDGADSADEAIGSDNEVASTMRAPMVATVDKKAKKNTKNDELERKQQAQLELLLLDEQQNATKHFNLRDLIKEEKRKDKLSKKSKHADDKDVGTQTDKEFSINVNDPRFAAVYSSHLFAIDPSAPQFKKTKGMKAIVEERQKRLQSSSPNSGQRPNEPSASGTVAPPSGKETSISHLVASIKRKNVQASAGKGKRSKLD